MAPSHMTHPAGTPTTSLLSANLICIASMLIWAAGLPAADHLAEHVGVDDSNNADAAAAEGEAVLNVFDQ